MLKVSDAIFCLTTILTTRGHFFESGERLLSAKIRYMVINFQNHFFISMTHPFHCELEISSGIAKHGAVAVPLRYNNDKRKKPLFSRGLSVCRHLFNSFSKLKCDEKIIEKRRLFH